MKYVFLALAGLRRKPVRTALTSLSIVTAFVLFGVLNGVTSSIDYAVDEIVSSTRLQVRNRVSVQEGLPVAHRSRIEAVDGVSAITNLVTFPAYYREARNQVPVVAIEFPVFSEIFPELELDQSHLDDVLATRNGAVVGENLLQRFGWSIGDRLTLSSGQLRNTDGTGDWSFEIVGSYRTRNDELVSNNFFVNYAYVDEGRAVGTGTVTAYFVSVDSPDQSAQISAEIDRHFVNSSMPTLTLSEQEAFRDNVRQFGDIDLFVSAIVGAVLFATLFVAGNTMVQSVRERRSEFAVLTAFGFSSRRIVGLILAEGLLLCVGAASVGLGLVRLVFPSIMRAMQVGSVALPLDVVAKGIAFSALLALLVTAVSLVDARRIVPASALAGR